MELYQIYVSRGSAVVNNRRSEMQIISEILDLSISGANKTKLLYQGNLSYSQLSHYLIFLLDKEILTEIKIKGGNGNGSSKIYRTTEKGLSCLEDINRVLTYLK